MKHRNFLFGALLASAFVVGALTPAMAKGIPAPLEPDNAVYDAPRFVDYNNPDVINKAAKPVAAAATTSVTIHYHNDDGQNATREYWIWCNGVNGEAYTPTVTNEGKDMEVTINFTGEHENFAGKKGMYFIVKTVGTWAGQSENMYIDYKEFPPQDNGHLDVWCIPGEGNNVEMYPTQELTLMDRFKSANFTDWKHIEVIASAVPTSYKLYALTSYYMTHTKSSNLEDYLIKEGSSPACTDVDFNGPSKKFTIELNYTPKINIQYYLEGVFPEYPTYTKTKYVAAQNLYETDRFRTYYKYDGDDLGATYKGSEGTTFKVWAPTAACVRVYIYDSGSPSDYIPYDHTATDDCGGYNMAFRPGGIWEVTITNRDLKNKYYTYSVFNSLGKVETIDPYAKACGINGQRGMIVDWKSTDPEGWGSVPLKWDRAYGYDIANPNDLSIYETHIRDLTMDETWTGTSRRGTYSAFAEPGTTYTQDGVTVTTGFDHIKELGVKAVHLLPVFDSDNLEGLHERSYNWGYNPQNYNCLDGSYASKPYDGAARVTEFKQLVQAYAKNGNHTRIIMDVVYNHVSNIGRSPFNRLMPRYYFRYTEGGMPYDGSGCGNEVKSEAPMMSKYIVDSLCWWAKEYKIKGFRFDLMALVDWQTVKKAAQELYKIDPDIYLYGEGWSADGSSGNMNNHNPGDPYYGNWGSDIWTVYNKLQKEGNMCFVGTFNSAGRDALAGETGKLDEWGFIDQGSEHVGGKSNQIADLLVGYHSGQERVDPNQCVNYASCHDDFALFDHLMYGICNDMSSDFPGLACAATAAVESTVMFSNGVALMRGGEEIFQSKEVSAEELELYGYDRTYEVRGKRISNNSYRLSDYTNAFRWDRKIAIDGVRTTDYFNAIKDAVHARSKITKYDKQQLDAHNPFNSSSPMNVWNRGDGSTVLGMKNGEYFFFVAGVNNDSIPFSSINTHNKKVFCSNPAEGGYVAQTGAIKLGWYTCVCLTKQEDVNMKKFLLLFALSSLMMVGCNNNKNENYGKEGDISVKFYLDFNALATNEIYEEVLVFNNSKLKEPKRPTAEQAPLPEFPVFKGWSTKEVIDDDKDLWNFTTDTVNVDSGTTEFRLYGFWASEGE